MILDRTTVQIGRQNGRLPALNRLVDVQAFMLSADDLFYISAVVFLALIMVIWLAKPGRGPGGATTAAGAH